MRQQIKNIALFLLLGIVVSSCGRSLFGGSDYEGEVLPGPTEVLYPCILEKKGDVGCGDVQLARINEIKEAENVLNPIAHFQNQFGGKFYEEFFELLLVEPDLRKSFVQKAEVKEVKAIEENKKELMKDCSTCNAVATIKFNGTDFRYPYTAPEKVERTLNDKYKLMGNTEHLDYTIYQNKMGENIRVSMQSNKGVVRSYRLVKGTKEDLLASMPAYKFPKKDRNRPPSTPDVEN